MHSVLNTPPVWVLVWSSGAGKSLPCGADPLLHPPGCPSLAAGLSPCRGVRAWHARAGPEQGSSSVGAQLRLLLSGVSWEHGKRAWSLMLGHLTSGLWKCFWQWLLSLCSALSCSSSLLRNLFLPSAWSPSENPPRITCPFSHIQPPSLCRDAWSKLLLLDCSPRTHLRSDLSAIIKG